MKSSKYFELIRSNAPFRYVWLSQMVSNFGDWFGILAVYALVLNYSDSALLLGLVIITKMLSIAVFSPIAGFITDRFNRKTVMIVSDIARAIMVSGFLVVDSVELIWLIYVFMAFQMMFSALFEPAKSATIPNITQNEALVSANIITSMTWSIIFTLGMGFGGIATAWVGVTWVFIINIISYLISAWFIALADIPDTRTEASRKALAKPFKGIIDGFGYIRATPPVFRAVIAKASYTSLMGGLLYMIILFAEEVLLMGSIGVGLIYAARGVGTGVGPVLGRTWFGDQRLWLFIIGFCQIIGGTFYFFITESTTLTFILLFAFLAHLATGFNWVMSTVLLQERSVDVYRGRVFSVEWLLFTVSQSVSVMISSLILEYTDIPLLMIMKWYALALVVVGIVWVTTIGRKDRRWAFSKTTELNQK